MIALFDLILSVIVLIVFFLMFGRLGEIRDLLKSIAIHHGATKPPEKAELETPEYEKYNPRWGKK